MWVAKRPALLADEQGLGKTASCVAYIASLLAEFKVTAPVLVVAPLSMLGFWEGEREGWVWGNRDKWLSHCFSCAGLSADIPVHANC